MTKAHELFHRQKLKLHDSFAKSFVELHQEYIWPTYHIRLTISCFGLESNNAFLVRSISVTRVFDLKMDEIDSKESIDGDHVS